MKSRAPNYLVLSSVFVLFSLAPTLFAQDLASFEKRVTVKTLANGLTVIVCERPEAPVFSFFTLVDTGSAQDPQGKTGLAHMFEHMAFKGTDTIGTKDYTAEKVALAKIEIAYAAYISERDKTTDHNDAKVKDLEKAWQDSIKDASQYVVANQFGQIVESNGGEGMNAFTADDETAYHYSFPENRLELWAYLESERFLHPVMRTFRPLAGAIHNLCLPSQRISPANRGLDVRPEHFFRDRRFAIFS
jgi:predicted Zn-dependent peptidase